MKKTREPKKPQELKNTYGDKKDLDPAESIPLEDRIKAQKEAFEAKNTVKQTSSEEARSVGMQAGSAFIDAVLAGGLVGYGVGYMLGNPALGLIFFMFVGFGLGIFRAANIMK